MFIPNQPATANHYTLLHSAWVPLVANSLIIESDNIINIMPIAGIVSNYVMHTTWITTLEESLILYM